MGGFVVNGFHLRLLKIGFFVGCGWVRAWHGTKLEALYRTMCQGALTSYSCVDKGERFLSGAPGVYVHKDATQHKADNYIRFVQLLPFGCFYAAKWEVRVTRTENVKPPR